MKGHISEPKIALLAGGDLGQREARRLAGHLAECPGCSASLLNYRQDRQSFALLRDAGVSPFELDDVRQSVLAQVHERAAPPWSWTPMRWSAVSSLVLIAVLFAVWKWEFVPIRQKPQLSEAKETPHVVQMPTRTGAASSDSVGPAQRQSVRILPNEPPRVWRPLREESQAMTALNQADNSRAMRPATAPLPDDVVMKLETPDPNVIIILLANSKGTDK